MTKAQIHIFTIVEKLGKGFGAAEGIDPNATKILNDNIEALLKLNQAAPDEFVDAILRSLNSARRLRPEVAQALKDRYGNPPLPKSGFRNRKSEKPKD